jgi:flagellar biosynthesis chaperone FliJ
MSVTRRFRYPLEAVLQSRRLDLGWARVEESNARRVVAEHQERAAAIRKAIAALEHEIRGMLQAGRALDLQQQEVHVRYLAASREQLAAKVSELTRARSVHEQTQRSVLAQSQKLQALERHREEGMQRHNREAAKAEEKAQDELWLTRAPGRG